MLRPGQNVSHLRELCSRQLRQISLKFPLVDQHQVLVPAEGALTHELVTELRPVRYSDLILIFDQEVGNLIKDEEVRCGNTPRWSDSWQYSSRHLTKFVDLRRFQLRILLFSIELNKLVNSSIEVQRENLHVQHVRKVGHLLVINRLVLQSWVAWVSLASDTSVPRHGEC